MRFGLYTVLRACVGSKSISFTQGRKLNMMDICCGLGTVSLAGQALTKAVTSTAPTDKRGIQVRHLVPAYSVCHQGHGKSLV